MGERRGTKALELWCRRMTEGYPGVKIDNMTTSWRDGIAFCAMVHRFRPDLIDFDKLNKGDIYYNNDLAFRLAESQMGIPALLDASDMAACEVPDRLSILTYLSQYYQAFAAQDSPSRISKRSTASGENGSIKTTGPPAKMAHIVGVPKREPCQKCQMPIFLAERVMFGKNMYHRSCLKCARCNAQLTLGSFYETEMDGEFCCETCPDEETTHPEEKNNSEILSATENPISPQSTTTSLAAESHKPQQPTLAEISRKSFNEKLLLFQNNGTAALLHKSLSDEEKSKSLKRLNEFYKTSSSSTSTTTTVPTEDNITDYKQNKAFSNFIENQVIKDDNNEDDDEDYDDDDDDDGDDDEDDDDDDDKSESPPKLPTTKPPTPPLNKTISDTSLNSQSLPINETKDILSLTNVNTIENVSQTKEEEGITTTPSTTITVDKPTIAMKPTPKNQFHLDEPKSLSNNTFTKDEKIINDNEVLLRKNITDDNVDGDINNSDENSSTIGRRSNYVLSRLLQFEQKLNSPSKSIEICSVNTINTITTGNKTTTEQETNLLTTTKIEHISIENTTPPSITNTTTDVIGNVNEQSIVPIQHLDSVEIKDEKNEIILQENNGQQLIQSDINLELKSETLENTMLPTPRKRSPKQLKNPDICVIVPQTPTPPPYDVSASPKKPPRLIDTTGTLMAAATQNTTNIITTTNSVEEVEISTNQLPQEPTESSPSIQSNVVPIVTSTPSSPISSAPVPPTTPTPTKRTTTLEKPQAKARQILNDSIISTTVVNEMPSSSEEIVQPQSKQTLSKKTSYPLDLNPFDDDSVDNIQPDQSNEINDVTADSRSPTKINSSSQIKELNSNPFDSSDDEIELEKSHQRQSLNPFDDDEDDDEQEEDSVKVKKCTPVPTPRKTVASTSLTTTPEPTPRMNLRASTMQKTPNSLMTDSFYGSTLSLASSIGSNSTYSRRRGKGRAPLPPPLLAATQQQQQQPSDTPKKITNPITNSTESLRYSTPPDGSPRPSPTTHRKKRPAPRPPGSSTPKIKDEQSSMNATTEKSLYITAIVDSDTNVQPPSTSLNNTPTAIDVATSNNHLNDLSDISNIDKLESSEKMSSITTTATTARRRIPLDDSIGDDSEENMKLKNISQQSQDPSLSTISTSSIYRRTIMPSIQLSDDSATSNTNVTHNDETEQHLHGRQCQKVKENKESQNKNRQSQISLGSLNGGGQQSPPAIGSATTTTTPTIPNQSNNNIYQSNDPQQQQPDNNSALYSNKSTYGKWKRRKGAAPPLPIPTRRSLQMVPLQEIRHELEIIEVQQQGLEKQGIMLEKMIRERCEGTPDMPIDELKAKNMVADDDKHPNSVNTKEVEDLILQLFEIVNEKNELFRRQAELMYLRRLHRLEQEQADIEYEIRLLMAQPERNKTDSDKAREEGLIMRKVEIVLLRNEIIDCLETDRIREAEEDQSIKRRMELHNAKRDEELIQQQTPIKLSKKEKKKQREIKKLAKQKKMDADKDADDTENPIKQTKEKKKLRKFLF